MKKEKLKKYLQIYSEIKDDIEKGKQMTYICRNNQKYTVNLCDWVLRLPLIIDRVLNTEKYELVKSAIEMWVKQGYKDKEILWRIPVSESTYYRWKNKFIWKVYALMVLYGYVSEEEIMNLVIE